jgi:wyosine [tRNA(Phe)-imidazoG37] synthetase (radical SAM superfamily)
MNYVFGPVHSRRLGLSLGVDPVQDKTCTLDCVYCQLGATALKTFKRGIFVPARAVLDEVRSVIDSGKKIDYITFSGTGEPTLNIELGSMISEIKAMSTVPIAVITNSTFIHLEDVRADLMQADLVIPSVDAVNQQVFENINRPHSGINLKQLLNGLETFSHTYTGRLWVEVMLVKGINDTSEELQALANYLNRLGCEKIQINTVTRPPAESNCAAVGDDVLNHAQDLFGSRSEIIGSTRQTCNAADNNDPCTRIHALVRSHPCTLTQLCSTLGLSNTQAEKALHILIDRQTVEKAGHGSKIFYRASGR